MSRPDSPAPPLPAPGAVAAYRTYADGSPIATDMRSLTSGRHWWRDPATGLWTDGNLVGRWAAVNIVDGPMTPMARPGAGRRG